MRPVPHSLLSRVLQALHQPLSAERLRLNREHWRELPKDLRLPGQLSGRWHISCGATHSVMERCDFACTSCYLSRSANSTPPLEAAEVYRQLDQLRAYLGPWGKAQITSGEVTLLPLETLGGYFRYAHQIGLDPMLMTHGQRLLDRPEYLLRLVDTYGLGKISIHIDSTQRGRRGWRPRIRESELHPIRLGYADLIRRVRRETGRRLYAAMTMTVTPESLPQVPEVIDWVARHADAFRMLSLQPVAAVGRTQDQPLADVSIEQVWQRVSDGLGHSINPRAVHFGHPQCNIVTPITVVELGKQRRIVELVRADQHGDKSWDRRFLDRLLGALGGFSSLGAAPWENSLKLVGLLCRHPLLAAELMPYLVYRLWGERAWLGHALTSLARGRLRLRPLALIVHKFMSAAELETELGQERLAACTFRLPVGEQMVSMCEVNASSLRLDLNQQQRAHSLNGCNTEI